MFLSLKPSSISNQLSTLWVRDHLSHLASHSAELVGPAGRLAALRRRAWWR